MISLLMERLEPSTSRLEIKFSDHLAYLINCLKASAGKESSLSRRQGRYETLFLYNSVA